MSKGDKYVKLKEYLKNCNLTEMILTFKDIESIIDNKLPQSAYKYSEQWWSNSLNHPQATAWLDAGYETDYVNDTYLNHTIIFVKR